MINRNTALKIMVTIILVAGATSVQAHKGSPWHDTGTAVALGFNSVYLKPIEEGVKTTFTFKYPSNRNTLEFVVGDAYTAMVFPDQALKDGIFTEEEVLVIKTGEIYDISEPLIIQFSIIRAGFYHLLFGPGPGTSILVLEPGPEGSISVEAEPGGSVEYLVRGTAGDAHIIKDPKLGMKKFVGWVGVMFDQARAAYEAKGVARGALPPLNSARASKIAMKLSEFGYFDAEARLAAVPEGRINAPFLGNINGMGVLAFTTAHLKPGRYTFAYDRRGSKFVIDQSPTIILQIAKDEALDDGIGTEDEILYRVVSSEAKPALDFEVSEEGYYHLMFGPGDGGFIMHLGPDIGLPVSITAKDKGAVSNVVKLAGINTVLENAASKRFMEVFFPCKLTDDKLLKSRGVMKNVAVPLDFSVAKEVMYWGLPIVAPLMLQRQELENKR